MNTTAKGDILENKSLEIVRKIVDEGLIGVMKEYAKIFVKKKYPSNIRGGGFVEFDLTIEIWPPNSSRYSTIYFIECKNYKSRVPIDKVKKFYADIRETSGVNAKGIFITNSPLQSGAYEYASAQNIMVIEGESKSNFNITLYKSSIKKENDISYILETLNQELIDEGVKHLTKQVDTQILSCLIPGDSNISYGIDLLSKSDIEKIASTELDNFNEEYLKNAYGLTSLELVNYLKNEYGIKVEYFMPNGSHCLGRCNIEKKVIGISKSIAKTPRELFVLGHEFGHYILHQKLSINQELMNSFSDSTYNFIAGKNRLENPKHWIEWQANYFSISFLLPRTSIVAKLWQYQLSKKLFKGKLYIDDLEINQKTFRDILKRLSNHFNISKTSIIYRLEEIDMITDKSRVKRISELINEYRSKYFI